MKKEIIISESDFNELDRKVKLYDKLKNSNTVFFNLYVGFRNRRPFIEDLDIETTMDEFKDDILKVENSIIKKMHFLLEDFNSYKDTQDRLSECQENLDKIPKWIKNLFI